MCSAGNVASILVFFVVGVKLKELSITFLQVSRATAQGAGHLEMFCLLSPDSSGSRLHIQFVASEGHKAKA